MFKHEHERAWKTWLLLAGSAGYIIYISLVVSHNRSRVTWFIYKSWNETGGPLLLLLLLAVQLFCLMFVSAFEITLLLACLVGGNSRGQTKRMLERNKYGIELHAYYSSRLHGDVLSFFFQRFREEHGTHRQNCWHGARVTDPLAFFFFLFHLFFSVHDFYVLPLKVCNWIH